MGVFGSLFGENFSEQAAPVDWKKLTDLKEFDAMLQESYINSVVVFKHSTRCSIIVAYKWRTASVTRWKACNINCVQQSSARG